MKLTVLQQTDEWVIVAKPAHLTVHRSEMSRGEKHYALQLARDTVGQKLWPIHRLDRPTSGCLVFATSPKGVARLQAGLTSDKAVKRYLAMVRGTAPAGETTFVDHATKGADNRRREAQSTITVLGSSPQPRCALFLVRPHQGRYHQVRKHCVHLSHPIIGDSAHGDTRINRQWRENWNLNRLALHCLSLDLPLEDGTSLSVTCPPAPELVEVWKQMPWWDEALGRCPELGLTLETP